MTPSELSAHLLNLGLSDTSEAAKWLGVSRRAVQRYVSKGPVPGPVARCVKLAQLPTNGEK